MKNIKKLLFISVFLGILIIPNISSAATVADLQAQIQALLAQISQLQAQLAQMQGQPATWCHDFNVNLKYGDSGSEVEALHIVLEKEQITEREFWELQNGIHYFGEVTASVVSGFQQKYKEEILAPWNLQYGTGFVGKTTRAKLNSLYGCGIIPPVECAYPCPQYSPPAPCESGYKQVCEQVKPNVCGCYPPLSCKCILITELNQPPVISSVSGPTTLNIGQTGTWTVKASDPEQGVLTYQVLWGDEAVGASAQLSQPLTYYSQTATFTHSYSKAGIYNPTFTVTDNKGLSAKTSISVNVGGITPPTLSVSLIANPSSGTAPLTPTLKAAVSGTDQGTINYKFDCNNDGTYEGIFNNVSDNPKTYNCVYKTDGTYTARVYVESDSAPAAEATTAIKVSSLPEVKIGITVDASKNLGEMPEVFKAGMWIAYLDDDVYIKDKFFSENMVGKIQINQPLSDDLRGSLSFEDYKQKLRESFAEGSINRKRIEDIKKTGETLIVGHWPAAMPRWLSSSSDTRLCTDSWWSVLSNSPPKCYDYECIINGEKTVGWAGVIDFTLRFYKDELGVQKLGYYLGHEQNKDWIGKEEDFYKLYKYTAMPAKSVDSNILIGGVGPWSWDAKRMTCDPVHYNQVGLEYCKSIAGWSIDNWTDPMNQNFIEYAKQNNLPIDFINWHAFAIRPDQFSEQTTEMKSWLEANGYSAEKVKFYPADWAYWSSNFAQSRGSLYYPFDQIDTEENSTYVLSSLYFMNKAGIQWHSHDFDVSDPPRESEVYNARKSEFIGDWTVFTRSQIIKPVYNSFKALSILDGKWENQTANRLETNFDDSNSITAIASQTKDKSKTRILISNFIPSGTMTTPYVISIFKSCMLSKGYTEDEWKQVMDALQQTAKNNPPENDPDKDGKKEINLSYVKWVINNTDFLDPLNDIKVRQDLNFCLPAVEKAINDLKYYSQNPREITLNLQNLPFSGKATLTTYTIDKDHSNSCRYNKRTESAPTNTECGVNGAVDRAVVQAQTEAKTKALQEAINYLKTKGYTDTQLNTIKSHLIEPCIGQEGFAQCVSTRFEAVCAKLNFSSSKCQAIKEDLTNAYKVYQEANENLFYYGTYTNSKNQIITTSVWIDKINNDPNVSLEGSKQTKQITIINGTYRGKISLQPYSVILLELGSGYLPPADTTPPAVSITGPTNGATVSGTITVLATASDNVGVSKVEFYADNVLKNTDAVAPYSFALDSAQLSNGLHTIMVKAYDAAGNTAQQSVIVTVSNVVADTTPPIVSIQLNQMASALESARAILNQMLEVLKGR